MAKLKGSVTLIDGTVLEGKFESAQGMYEDAMNLQHTDVIMYTETQNGDPVENTGFTTSAVVGFYLGPDV